MQHYLHQILIESRESSLQKQNQTPEAISVPILKITEKDGNGGGFCLYKLGESALEILAQKRIYPCNTEIRYPSEKTCEGADLLLVYLLLGSEWVGSVTFREISVDPGEVSRKMGA